MKSFALFRTCLGLILGLGVAWTASARTGVLGTVGGRGTHSRTGDYVENARVTIEELHSKRLPTRAATPEAAPFQQRAPYGSLWSFGVKGSF